MVIATPTHKTTPFRSQSTPKRPPLLSSDDKNGRIPVRTRAREVSSRYLSTSSSSSNSNSNSTASLVSNSLPLYGRRASPSTVRRAQSVERRRPATPRPSGVMSEAAKLLLNSSRRSLSVSFQGESYAVPRSNISSSSRSKIMNNTSVKKGETLERKRSAVTPRRGAENAKPIKQPWPGRVVSMSRSVDLGSGRAVRALQESLINSEGSFDATFRRIVNSSSVGLDSLVSDVESVSSDGNADLNSSLRVGGRGKGGGRTVVVPPRYLQRGSEPGSPIARTNISKLILVRKFGSDSPGASPRGIVSNRGFSSPLHGDSRPASPSRLGGAAERMSSRPASPIRLGVSERMSSRSASPAKLGGASERMSSPCRDMVARVGSSPVRARNALTSTRSAVCFGADVRRMKVGDNRLGDAHLLRLLHNRHLQWRFVNTRAGALLSIQQVNVERSLYNAWRTTSDLRIAVSLKRKELQWLRMKLRLLSILKGQILHLEEWALMDNDHFSSLSGLIDSLKASTIRLPLVSGARADIQELKDGICSAADVMHSMASSICSLLRKVEEVNSLVADVASLYSKEHSFLKECEDTLSMLAAMQIKDSSLRAHVLQLRCDPSSVAVGA